MSGQCRIGCLPWFAGVWWLGVCYVLNWATRAIIGAGLPLSWAWKTLDWCQAAGQLSLDCAREGGAE